MPNLCSLASVKTYLGISGTTEDTNLTALISAASQGFMNQIKRPDFAPTADYTDFLCGNGRSWIFLNHYPAISITSLTMNGTVIPQWDDSTPDTLGWFFDDTLPPENRLKLRLRGNGACFPLPRWEDYRGIQVVYNAGYSTDGDPAIPDDVAQAVREWVAYLRNASQIQAQNPATTSVALGDYTESAGRVLSESLAYLESALPSTVLGVIENYTKPQI